MKYYELEPEVAGGFGDLAELDSTLRPPRIINFHYQFDGWLGDPIIETVASFIVTAMLKKKIETHRLTGVQFGNVHVSTSPEFDDVCPGIELPSFAWLKVTGQAGETDFGLSSSNRLVVSERVLDLLKAEGMRNCEISPFIE